MAVFKLQRKRFSEWNQTQLDALRQFKAQGFTGKELRDKVAATVNHTKTGGNYVSLTGAPSKSANIANKPVNITADKAFRNVTQTQNSIVRREAAQQAKRAANKAASNATAFKAGKNSVGILGGLKNTWRSGAAGKAGIIAAGTALALGTSRAIKNSRDNNNNPQPMQ